MNGKTRAQFEARARIVKAMAHPARLCMVDALAEKERCVRDLTEIVGADISTVSKHLTLLKNAGIVAAEKRGNQVFYSLRVPCILKFFGCCETVIKTVATEQLKMIR
ncbi:MAG: metalloregulator ArsR/SmtB family transcription factor [Elusimicrobiota bacterium]